MVVCSPKSNHSNPKLTLSIIYYLLVPHIFRLNICINYFMQSIITIIIVGSQITVTVTSHTIDISNLFIVFRIFSSVLTNFTTLF